MALNLNDILTLAKQNLGAAIYKVQMYFQDFILTQEEIAQLLYLLDIAKIRKRDEELARSILLEQFLLLKFIATLKELEKLKELTKDNLIDHITKIDNLAYKITKTTGKSVEELSIKEKALQESHPGLASQIEASRKIQAYENKSTEGTVPFAPKNIKIIPLLDIFRFFMHPIVERNANSFDLQDENIFKTPEFHDIISSILEYRKIIQAPQAVVPCGLEALGNQNQSTRETIKVQI